MGSTEHPPRLFADEASVRRIGQGFCACTLAREEWTHEAHLATCLWLILERPDISPERDLPDMIRRFNESVGGINDETQGYHETITQGSIIGVRRYLEHCGSSSLLDCINGLLVSPEGRRDWLLQFYDRDQLFSTEARLRWIEPGLKPLVASP